MKTKTILSILAISAGLMLTPSCGHSSDKGQNKNNTVASTDNSASANVTTGTTEKNKPVYVYNPEDKFTKVAGFGIYGDKVAVGSAGGPEAAIISVGKINTLNDIRDTNSVEWDDSVPYQNEGGYIVRIKYRDEIIYVRVRLTDAPEGQIAYEYSLI